MCPVTLATQPEAIQAVRDMKHATADYVTALCGPITGGSAGRLAGSGTFLTLCGETYLLTADHVMVEGLQRYGELLRRSGAGVPRRIEHWTRSEWRLDLTLAPSGYDPSTVGAPAHLLATGSQSVDDEHLFIQGFPERDSRFTAFLPGLLSDSLPYLTYTSDKCKWADFDPSVHFAIDYPPPERLQIDENGQSIALPPPHGMSGSTVWSLGNRLGTGWAASQARIVGLAHRWDPVGHTLVVTRIEAMRPFLLDAVHLRSAFLNWCGRGRPDDDPLPDWSLATQRIPTLV